MKLDILVFSAHPDDAELGCSGTIASLIFEQQKKTGIVDITKGELGTRGDADLRAKEAQRSKEILQLSIRENLGMEDGFFRVDKKSILQVIKAIRNYQPDIIFSNAPSDRHPDHARAHQLVKESVFLSGLEKIETKNSEGNVQKKWKPYYVFSYIQDKYLEPDFIFDISSYMQKKMDSILAFQSQFYSKQYPSFKEPQTYISTESFLESVRYRAALLGKKIGVKYAEGFISEKKMGLKNFDNLVFKMT